MKSHPIFYLCIAILSISCGEKSQKDSTKSDYYSTKIDTSYNVSSRTKIDGINRHIYDKFSSDSKKRLLFQMELKGEKSSKFHIMKIDASDLKDAKTSSLVFKNVSEIETFFSKIDALGVDENLLEREKTKHYEINKGKRSVDITQFDGDVNIPYKMKLSNSEYDGIKSAFERYLLE